MDCILWTRNTLYASPWHVIQVRKAKEMVGVKQVNEGIETPAGGGGEGARAGGDVCVCIKTRK